MIGAIGDAIPGTVACLLFLIGCGLIARHYDDMDDDR